MMKETLQASRAAVLLSAVVLGFAGPASAGVLPEEDEFIFGLEEEEERPSRQLDDAASACTEEQRQVCVAEMEARMNQLSQVIGRLEEDLRKARSSARADARAAAQRGGDGPRYGGRMYGSLRPAMTYYQDDYDDLILTPATTQNPNEDESNTVNVTDDRSRLGMRSSVEFNERTSAFMHAEWDIDLGEDAELGGARLAYAGLRSALGVVAIGRQYDPFYTLIGEHVDVFNTRRSPYGYLYALPSRFLSNVVTYDLVLGPLSFYGGVQLDGDRDTDTDRRGEGLRFDGTDIGPNAYVDAGMFGVRLNLGRLYIAAGYREDRPANYLGSETRYLQQVDMAVDGATTPTLATATGVAGMGAVVTNRLTLANVDDTDASNNMLNSNLERNRYDRTWQGIALGMEMADWLNIVASFQEIKVEIDQAVQVDVKGAEDCAMGTHPVTLANAVALNPATMATATTLDIGRQLQNSFGFSAASATNGYCGSLVDASYDSTAWDLAVIMGYQDGLQLKLGYFDYDDDGSSGVEVKGYTGAVQKWLSEEFMVFAEYLYEDFSDRILVGKEQDFQQTLSFGFRYDFEIGF